MLGHFWQPDQNFPLIQKNWSRPLISFNTLRWNWFWFVFTLLCKIKEWYLKLKLLRILFFQYSHFFHDQCDCGDLFKLTNLSRAIKWEQCASKSTVKPANYLFKSKLKFEFYHWGSLFWKNITKELKTWMQSIIENPIFDTANTKCDTVLSSFARDWNKSVCEVANSLGLCDLMRPQKATVKHLLWILVVKSVQSKLCIVVKCWAMASSIAVEAIEANDAPPCDCAIIKAAKEKQIDGKQIFSIKDVFLTWL